MGLLIPGTLTTAIPAAVATPTAPRAMILRNDTLRPADGRCSGGRSRDGDGAGGGVAEAGPVVLGREKFTEGLPFIVGQGAEVAVENQAG